MSTSSSVPAPNLLPIDKRAEGFASGLPKPLRIAIYGILSVGVLIVVAILVWQGITAAGSPDPTTPNTSPAVAILDIGVLVFREGLECILVLAAIMAGLSGSQQDRKKPIAAGVGIGFVVTVITWFIAIGILSDLNNSVSALNLQAATGLLAIVVLMVVMNWFFHSVYWGGWITAHNRRKKSLLADADAGSISARRLWWGLAALGFASFYREGFEIVLFLQSYRLKMGTSIVLTGAALGAVLSGIVAVLAFIAHRRLPYRQMLISTGVMLGLVLLVMVGEQAQEMQQAHWIPTTTIASLDKLIPDWMGVWFSIFPTVESLAAQGVAAALVIGSYFGARHISRLNSGKAE